MANAALPPLTVQPAVATPPAPPPAAPADEATRQPFSRLLEQAGGKSDAAAAATGTPVDHADEGARSKVTAARPGPGRSNGARGGDRAGREAADAALRPAPPPAASTEPVPFAATEGDAAPDRGARPAADPGDLNAWLAALAATPTTAANVPAGGAGAAAGTADAQLRAGATAARAGGARTALRAGPDDAPAAAATSIGGGSAKTAGTAALAVGESLPARTAPTPQPSADAPLAAVAAPGAAPIAGAAAPVAEARLGAHVGSPGFAQELGAQLTTFARDGVQHARLELNPAEMGPVSVRIELDGQTAQVHLAADHVQTRTALEQSMPLLAGSLREAGLTLGGGGVSDQPRQPAQPFAGSGSPGGASAGAASGEGERAAAAAAAPRRRGVVDLVA